MSSVNTTILCYDTMNIVITQKLFITFIPFSTKQDGTLATYMMKLFTCFAPSNNGKDKLWSKIDTCIFCGNGMSSWRRLQKQQ